MSYEILFTDEHREKVKDKWNESVLESLEQRLEKKQSELELVDRRNQAGNRFYNLFGYGGVTVAEARFRSDRRKYRAILFLVDGPDVFVFYRVIEKEDRYESSKQRKVLDDIEGDPEKFKDYAKTEVVENMDLF